jgi:hypothetical protein
VLHLRQAGKVFTSKKNLPMKKIQLLFTSILALNIISCTSDPVSSSNRFFIDNQSTTDLFYITGFGLDERTIEIPPFNTIEIEEAAYDGDRALLITADEFFPQTEDDIFLLKEEDGNLVEALQLNIPGVLNWQTEMVNDFTYNHTLVVTDEMLN